MKINWCLVFSVENILGSKRPHLLCTMLQGEELVNYESKWEIITRLTVDKTWFQALDQNAKDFTL